jgi:hypothetical protein
MRPMVAHWKLTAEIDRLVEAVASGDSPSVIKGISARESRLADVRARIEHLDGLAKVARLDKGPVRVQLKRRLQDWRKLLDGEPELAKQMLKKICPHGIRFTATSDGWRFMGDAAIEGLLPTTRGMSPDTIHIRSGIYSVAIHAARVRPLLAR